MPLLVHAPTLLVLIIHIFITIIYQSLPLDTVNPCPATPKSSPPGKYPWFCPT